MSLVTGPDRELEKFERMVADHQTALLRMCCLHLGDLALAEDAVQETFLKAWRALSAFRGESSEKTWLMRIAINVCRDMQRGNWFRFVDRRRTASALPEAVSPIEPYEEQLVADVMNLPVKLREVILLYYYQGMNTLEIADSLGISQSSVSGRLKRGREKLKKELEGSDDHV
ncbi:MAG: sigma-70 family RNA polymerase sigma factor [Clostridia bacterium]|nr:sigma-70 family RNA polymerase sigma factor [Clostridia bacterium]